MRRLAALATALTVALLAGCAGTSSDGAGGGTSDASPTEAAFPVTIEHKYGSTTLDSAPERIVVVGLQEQDALLALGVVPVATTEWFGEQPGALWPWAKEKLGAAALPEVLTNTDGFQYERIAALKPDVILGLYAGMTETEYKTLTAIAPTVAQPGDVVDWGIGWERLTTTVGQIVGKPAEAQAVVSQAEEQLTQAGAANPAFAGSTAVVATPYQGFYLYGPQDNRSRLLKSLGFELPEGLADVAGSQFGGSISTENADMLDVDVIVWLLDDVSKGTKQLHADPVYSKLAVAKEGREVMLNTNEGVGAATSFVTVLSIPYLVTDLVPQLATALGQVSPAAS
ncbi:MAG: iron-siderophore ABC transporter substrate-binding protein [Candidatus Nanopelagicales bacterium]